MNNDLISREALKKAFEDYEAYSDIFPKTVYDIIDNAPTVEIPVARWDAYCEGQKVGYEKAIDERPQGDTSPMELVMGKCPIEAGGNCPLKSQSEWISVSERLPNDLEPVNITWINHDPEPYYKEIKDKPFTTTGVYFNGQWYWWSVLCTDILANYSFSYDDIIDKAIEVIAWMPLPEPYKEEGAEE